MTDDWALGEVRSAYTASWGWRRRWGWYQKDFECLNGFPDRLACMSLELIITSCRNGVRPTPARLQPLSPRCVSADGAL